MVEGEAKVSWCNSAMAPRLNSDMRRLIVEPMLPALGLTGDSSKCSRIRSSLRKGVGLVSEASIGGSSRFFWKGGIEVLNQVTTLWKVSFSLVWSEYGPHGVSEGWWSGLEVMKEVESLFPLIGIGVVLLWVGLKDDVEVGGGAMFGVVFVFMGFEVTSCEVCLCGVVACSTYMDASSEEVLVGYVLKGVIGVFCVEVGFEGGWLLYARLVI